MIVWIYLILHDITCIVSGTILIVTGHDLWAIIPFALAAFTTVKKRR